MPRRKVTPPAVTSCSPSRGSRSVTRPCSRLRSSGVAVSARSIISRTAGILLRDLGALGVAEREHVEQQRLLDLGVVEEVAAALGRDLGMVGQHDRRAEHRVVLRRGEHRIGVQVVPAAPRAARGSGPPRCGAPRGWRCSECISASPRPASASSSGVSLCTQRLTSRRPSSRTAVRIRTRPRSGGCSNSTRPGSRRLDAALLALVPVARGLQEAHLARHLAVALQQALDPQALEAARVALRVGGRVDDAERRGRGVLRGPGRVRVEGVALVEERVDQLVERRAHVASVLVAASRSATAASLESSARSAACSRSPANVSPLSRTSPPSPCRGPPDLRPAGGTGRSRARARAPPASGPGRSA